MTETKRNIDWGLLIIGALFVILGFYLFTKPEELLLTLVWMIGFLVLFQGISQLFLNRRINRTFGRRSGTMIVFGIVNIVIGIIFIFNSLAGAAIITFLFAFWLIITSIGDIILSSYFTEHRGSLYWTVLTFGIIGLIFGILMLFNPFISALTLSFIATIAIILMGVQMIVRALKLRV